MLRHVYPSPLPRWHRHRFPVEEFTSSSCSAARGSKEPVSLQSVKSTARDSSRTSVVLSAILVALHFWTHSGTGPFQTSAPTPNEATLYEQGAYCTVLLFMGPWSSFDPLHILFSLGTGLDGLLVIFLQCSAILTRNIVPGHSSDSLSKNFFLHIHHSSPVNTPRYT